MHKNTTLAIFGGNASFSQPINVGQLYFPEWQRYENAMRGIFERKYYNNNGPLLSEFEQQLAQFFGVKHAICVHNATFGLMMLVEAMGLKGKVIVPAFTFIATVQALAWAKLTPVFCDVDPLTHQLDLVKVRQLVDGEVSAVMGVNLWGGACQPEQLESLCNEYGIKLLFDSAHATGCEVNGKMLGGFGSAEVFSFHATKMLSTTEGGCITTNDDKLAGLLETMRPSYGKTQTVDVVKVINARMSEAQAAIGLLNLADFEKNRQHNEEIYHTYVKGLHGVPGIEIVQPSVVSRSNYQYMVLKLSAEQFGMTRDQLQHVLVAENVNVRRYFYPGVHRTIEFEPVFATQKNALTHTDELCRSCMQLPVGANVDILIAEKICALIASIQQQAKIITEQLHK